MCLSTSAVEQNLLDAWSITPQGQLVAQHLREILGKRENFSKGREHFDYVSQSLNCQKIIYVADAVAEIESGAEYRSEFNIIPVGFANVITVKQVLEAVQAVLQSLSDGVGAEVPYPLLDSERVIDGGKISLPSRSELESALLAAGADSVVEGTKDSIAAALRSYLASREEKFRAYP